MLKSRRVVPARLLASGFKFRFPAWPWAAVDLCRRWRDRETHGRDSIDDSPTSDEPAEPPPSVQPVVATQLVVAGLICGAFYVYALLGLWMIALGLALLAIPNAPPRKR